ncbi:MAG TPA: hypothetical protein VGO01_24100, partial [Bradyrhizobium sp.]|nr:hypothetical protein [Bradyrhizobium sp.]
MAGHRETWSNAATFPAEAAQIRTVHDAGDLLAQIRLPERELGPRIRDRVRGRGANVVHELVRKPLVDNEQRKASGFRYPNRRQEPNHVRRRAPASTRLPAWRHQ